MSSKTDEVPMCGRKGHVKAKCYRNPKIHDVKAEEETEYEFATDTIHIDHADEVTEEEENSDQRRNRYPSTLVKIKVNNKFVYMHVDSGAEANIMNEGCYSKLDPKPKLKSTSVKLKPYKSKPIPCKGYFTAEVAANGLNKKDVKIYVTEGNEGRNLLGKYTAFELNILEINLQAISQQGEERDKGRKVEHLSYEEMKKHLSSKEEGLKVLKRIKCEGNEEDMVDALKKEFPTVFKGIGKHRFREVKLIADEDVKPMIQPMRRIPFARRDKLEEILKELEMEDVIEDVNGPTEWISNVVMTPKAEPGQMRMNIDMTGVNKAVKRTRHVIPTVEEMKVELNGMKHFSKIDLKHGYMQFQLEEGSRHLTTFYTHKGLRRAKRLMFGINSASEIFNEEIKQTISDIENALNIYDDIVVCGRNKAEHDLALCLVFQRLRDCGLTVNLKKCVFNKPKIEFFGIIFSEKGTSPSQEKIEALKKMKRPESAAEVRSFLGMANFSCHFIRNYSAITAPLRELTKKRARFVWTEECQTAFMKICDSLSEKSLNAYFNPKRETKVIVDGSKKDGLGAMLTQKEGREWEVIRYDSRPLEEAEKTIVK